MQQDPQRCRTTNQMVEVTGLRHSLFPYEYFLGVELKLLGQADSLTAIIHEDFRFALLVPLSESGAFLMAYTQVYAKRRTAFAVGLDTQYRMQYLFVR